MPRFSQQHRAIALMILSCACFSLMSTCIREVSGDLPTTTIVFLRNACCVLILLPFMLRGGLANFRTARISTHIFRAAIGIVGMELWFYCVSILPLNQATALSYTSPLFTTLFAAWWLKEKLTRPRILALVIGFIGALIILRPDPSSFDTRALLVLCATSMWAIAGITVKSLTSTEPPLRIVFYMSVFMSCIAFPVALPTWETPHGDQWFWLFVIASVSLTAQLSLAHAFQRAEVASLMPYDFGRLLFTAAFAWIAFREPIDPLSWLGAAIIIGSTVYITRRETKRAAQATAAGLEP